MQGVPRWQQRWSSLKVPSAMAPGGGQPLLPEPPCLVPLTMCARCPPPVQLEAVARVLEEGNIKTMSQHSKQTSFLCMYRLKADAPQNAQS